MGWKRVAILVAVVVAGLVVLGRISDIFIDWLWFSSVRYSGVFWTIFIARAALSLAVFAISAGALWLSGHLALRRAERSAFWRPNAHSRQLQETFPVLVGQVRSEVPWRLLITGGAVLVGLLVAIGESSNYDVALRFLHQVPYGQKDPVFGKDIGFYLFSLPAYVALKNWLMLLLVCCVACSGAVYWAQGDIRLDKEARGVAPIVIAHGSALLGLFFALMAWSYGLDRFLLLYGDNGVVVGADYTDLHVRLPVSWLQIGLAAVALVASWVNMRRRTYRIPIAAVILVFGGSIVLSTLYPALYERLHVKPSELQLETPYIERNIALTQEAYGLQHITVKSFPAESGLSLASLQANRPTIDNIRLWDSQPLKDTYAQLQEIRTYYKFLDIDIDRYRLNGTYQQVMLSPRELDPSLLPANAQTWVNLHLLFTHGNGVVMSPVTQKSSEGLPILYLQDIPPVASGGPTVSEPRIYFGEADEDYVIVKSDIPEFDYPKGTENVYASYTGSAGVAIGSMTRRSLFAWHYDDPNILLTSYITRESRILFHRNIQDRVRAVAPFLLLDHDPYIVVSDGRLFWIQDAYTTSEWFPYAKPIASGEANYIRNSVKIAIDAYNGSMAFYVSDPDDPIIRTYERIFPDLFKPLSFMPTDLQRHIRYPEDLFLVQAQLYRTYHMNSPEVFYNQEDLWQFPSEPGVIDGGRGNIGAPMAPYYMIMRLPDQQNPEYVLMLPMVPSQRQNMIAWLAARCDPPDYGKLVVYEFPKEKLVYGPSQIEARLQQNTEISQQISLWNQMGSRVIRGPILVVPIENSILYVSPLYLRAETGQMPELKRVIAAYGDRVVMEETLGAALAALFKETAPMATLPSAAGGPPTVSTEYSGAREALAHYDRAIERLKEGDWSGFGAELNAMRPLLESLGRPPVGR